MMPEMDGRQLQQRLLQQQSPMALIALTGRGELNDAVTMLKLGAVDYLEKPVCLHRLQSALATAYQLTEKTLSASPLTGCTKCLPIKSKELPTRSLTVK